MKCKDTTCKMPTDNFLNFQRCFPRAKRPLKCHWDGNSGRRENTRPALSP